MELQFSERQRATVAAALTVLGTAVIIWAVWTASLLLARFVAFFSGVFLPLAVAASRSPRRSACFCPDTQ